MKIKRGVLIGLLVTTVTGSIALGVMSKPCEEYVGERMGGTTASDTSILDMAPVQELKVYMKGGD